MEESVWAHIVFRNGQHIKLGVNRNIYDRLQRHSTEAPCARAPFSGTDSDGRPFIVDVGAEVVALYSEARTSSEAT